MNVTRLKSEQGSITLEAAIILPMFICFIIGLIAIIQFTRIELILQSSVTEMSKVIATNMYPVELLYEEFNKSDAGLAINEVIDRANDTRNQILSAEQLVTDYSFFIPEPMLVLFRWMQQQRLDVEQGVLDEANHLLNAAFKEVLVYFLKQQDASQLLNYNKLTIVQVTLPSFEQREQAFFAIELTYEVTLPIPFMNKTMIIRKKGYERVWIGA